MQCFLLLTLLPLRIPPELTTFLATCFAAHTTGIPVEVEVPDMVETA